MKYFEPPQIRTLAWQVGLKTVVQEVRAAPRQPKSIAKTLRLPESHLGRILEVERCPPLWPSLADRLLTWKCRAYTLADVTFEILGHEVFSKTPFDAPMNNSTLGTVQIMLIENSKFKWKNFFSTNDYVTTTDILIYLVRYIWHI